MVIYLICDWESILQKDLRASFRQCQERAEQKQNDPE